MSLAKYLFKQLDYKYWPILFILLVWSIFAHPYFFKGLVPFPSKYQVTFFHPWSVYEKWWGPVKNNAMPDVISQIYPWKHFTIDSYKKGQVPLWNPYSFAGNPNLANSQSAVLSPFNLLFLVLPFIDAWSIVVLLQPLLAGIFTYLFLRELKISDIGSLLGSITFMFCGFNVVWMAYGTLSMVIAFLPLGLYGIEKAYSSKKYYYFLITTIAIALSFFSGHLQTSLYLTGFVLCYILFRFLLDKNRILFLQSIVFFILGIFLASIQIYPTFMLYQNSVRSESVHVGGGIPWNYFITMIAPDFYGNPVTRNDWFGTYAEWSSFIGIIPLLFALLTIFMNKNRRHLFFLFTGSLALIFSTESIFHSFLIATKIPILATSIPSRVIVLFSFSASILAGFGMDYMIKKIKEKSYKNIFAVYLALLLFILLIWALLYIVKVLPADKSVIAMKNLILPTVFLFGVGLIIGINKFVTNKLLLHTSYFILLALVCFDSLRFAGKWMPFDPKNLVYPDLSVVKAMQDKIGSGRVFGNIGTEATTYYNLSSSEGYDPLYIRRYGEFVRFASTGKWSEAERSVAKFDRRSKLTPKALDILGVNIIYHPIADTNTVWAFPVWEDDKRYSIIYQDDKFKLYKNNSALPRVKLFYEYEVINDGEKILKRLFNERFDINKKLILENKPKVTSNDSASDEIASISDGNSKASIISYSPNKVVIKTDTTKSALLYISDSFYPSWKVFINGEESEIYRANYTFRAVEVPSGKSTVEFKYSDFY